MNVRRFFTWCCIFVLLFLIGFLRTTLILRSIEKPTTPLIGIVNKPPLIKADTQRFQFKDQETHQIVEVVTTAYPTYQYGDLLHVEGKIQHQKIYYAQIRLLKHNQGSWILDRIYLFRDKLNQKTAQLFIEPYATLVSGIVFGTEGDLGVDLSEKLRQAGLIHVVVASGYNVSVVIAYLIPLVKLFGQKIGFILMITGIITYAIVAGVEPPIIRASIMGVATILAVFAGRQKHSLLWLFFAAISMLLLKPLLYKSLSFQLSFLATLAISTIQPVIERSLLLFPRIIREDTATTLSVYIFTMPLIWLRFGFVQPQVLIVNMLTLWLIPAIMFGSTIVIIFGFAVLFLGRIFAIPVYLMLVYVLRVVEIFT